MNFSEELRESVKEKRLLCHPFYQAWEAGELNREILKTYAKQYYHHVQAFPRYISAAHSLCEDFASRQVLTDNLHDEESGPENHPKLWMDFAKGMGSTEEEAESEVLTEETRNLIDTFLSLARSSYVEGLTALYIYEQQIPEICETKIKGLQEFYGVKDAETIEYFRLHGEVDVLHSEATGALVDSLPEEEKERARAAAERAAEALWGFLDGMNRVRGEQSLVQ